MLSIAQCDFTINKPTGCVPLNAVLFTDITPNVASRSWNLDNGTIIPSPASVTAGRNFLTPGVYNIRLDVVYTNGTTDYKEKQVTVHPKPVANFSSMQLEGCVTHVASFTDLSYTNTGTITNWQWDFGLSSSNVQNPLNVSFNTAGNYQVSLIVTNSFGCTSDARQIPNYIKVYPVPDPSFTTDVNNTCGNNLPVNFINTTMGTGPIRYTWVFGDDKVAGTAADSAFTQNTSHTYLDTGIYKPKLIASIGSTCKRDFSTNYFTDIHVGTPKAKLVTAPTVVCQNQPIFFSGTSSPSEFNYSGRWVFTDNNTTYNGYNINRTFTTPGIFNGYFITSTLYNCFDTAKFSIEVKPAPVIRIRIDKPTGACFPHKIVITNNTVGADLKFAWNFGDGTPTDTTRGQVPAEHTYTREGYFTITMKAIDTSTVDGCIGEDVYRYVIVQKPNVDFTYVPPSGCLPLPVKFTPQVRNNILPITTYIWQFGDGEPDVTTSSPDPVTHTYTTAGTFQARLKIITGGCEDSSIFKTVAVESVCDDDGGGGGGGGGGGFTVGKNCMNKYEVVFEDTIPNSTVISWDFGDGSPLYTGPPINPVTYIYSPPQKQYVVTVTRRDNTTGVTSTSPKRVIIIDEKANYDIDVLDICKDKTVKFRTIGIDSSAIKKYTWDFGDLTPRFIINNEAYFNTNGIYLNGNTEHQYNTNGEFYTKLIIEDKLGCKDSIAFPLPVTVKGPIAGFKADTVVACSQNFKVTFTDTSKQNGNTPIVEWRWNFGDGTPAYVTTRGDTAVPHTYTTNNYVGLYNVTLTIKDAIGCESVERRNDYVKVGRPKADFFSYNTLQCGSYNAFFYNYSSTYSTSKYSWDYGDNSPITTSFYGSHTYATEGNYKVTLMVEDALGCKDTTEKPNYINIVKPKAEFSIRDTNQCAPAVILFKDSSTYANTYVWDFGDMSTGSTAKDPAPKIYGRPGFYDVTLSIVGVSGCKDSITKKIQIKGPIATLKVEGNSGCKPLPVTLKAEGQFIDTYSWDFNDGTIIDPSVGTSPAPHTYTVAGKYVPNVVLRSPEGCPVTLKAQDTIYVDSAKADFNIINPTYCGEGLVRFVNTSKVPDFSEIKSYEWDFGDMSTLGFTASPTHFYKRPGVYNVKLTIKSKYDCVDDEVKTQSVTIYAKPVPQIVGDMVACKPGTYLYEGVVNSIDAINTYEWFVNGTLVANTKNLDNYYFNAGNYTLDYKVTTVNGCDSLDTKNIIVDSVKSDFTISETKFCDDKGTVTFTNKSGSKFGISSYKWLFGDNKENTVDASPRHTYQQPGIYTVTLISFTANGCSDTLVLKDTIKVFANPIPTIQGDNVQCKPGSYTYIGVITSADAIANYEWQVNGTVVATTQNLNNYYFNAGTYTLGYKVTTVNGCDDLATKDIIVDSIHTDFDIVDNTLCGANNLATFVNKSGSKFAGTTYVWSFGDGGTSSEFSPTYEYSTPNVYTVKLQATTVNNCPSEKELKNAITLFANPVIEVMGTPEKCAKETIAFTSAIQSQDAITNYIWTLDGVVFGDNTNKASYTFNTDGNYMVNLQVKTTNGCDVNKNYPVVIRPLPVPQAAPDTTICEGSSIQLNATDGLQYEWIPNYNLSSNTIASPMAMPLATTTYVVKVTNQYSCVSKDSIVINVDKKVNLTVSDDVAICRGSSTQLQASGNSNNYLWTPSTGLSNANISNPIASPVNTTLYKVIAKSNNVCSNEEDSILVTVGDIPTVQLPANITLTAGELYTLNPILTGPITSYTWTPATGLSCTSCPTPNFIADADITYKLEVTTQYNCRASDQVFVKVLCGKGAVYIPNAITPNGDGLNDILFVKGYGISKVKHFRVYDRWGKLVFNRENYIPTNDRQYGWDGSINGNMIATSNTFVYNVEIICAESGKAIQFQNTVTVIR
jgi:gliding motility-associated-like protein